MMPAVRGDPEDRTAFQCQRTADGQEVLKPLERLESTVGVEAVVTHTDAEPDGHPVHDQGNDQIAPAQEPECRDSLDVEPNQNAAREDAQLVVSGPDRM